MIKNVKDYTADGKVTASAGNGVLSHLRQQHSILVHLDFNININK